MRFRCSLLLVLLLAVFCCEASSRDEPFSILSTGQQQEQEPLLASVVSTDDPFPFHLHPPDEPRPPHFPSAPPPESHEHSPPPHVRPPPPPEHRPPHESPPAPAPETPPAPVKPPPAPKSPPPPKPTPHPDPPAPSPSHDDKPVVPPSPSPEDEEKSPPPPPSPHHPAATLVDLKISKGKLVPKFKPDIHNYSATVSSSVKKIRITSVVPEDYETSEYTISINNIPVKSGAPSPQLSVGKTGKTVLFEVCVTVLEHESSTYYILLEREKSKWEKFGTKFLLALAIILIVVVVGFLCYGCYLCVQSGRIPAFWPLTYFSRDRSSDYTSLGAGPSGRP